MIAAPLLLAINIRYRLLMWIVNRKSAAYVDGEREQKVINFGNCSHD